MLSKDKIQALQQQLRTLGYDIGKTGADGVIGNNTKKALANAEKAGYVLVNGELIAPNKQNYTKSNSPYALAHRSLVGNIYPYDYNPEVSFDANNIAGYNEFLTLDLNTPEGMARAEEIRKMTQANGQPLFSNRNITDNKELQR
jgi:peptidoglycan hydrolase-like protein with peptidoglycan-binding domain